MNSGYVPNVVHGAHASSAEEISVAAFGNRNLMLSPEEIHKVKRYIRCEAQRKMVFDGEPADNWTITFEFAVPDLRFVYISVDGARRIELSEIEV